MTDSSATAAAAMGRDMLDDVCTRVMAWASPERSFVADLVSSAELDAGARMLDLGCGTGYLLSRAAHREPSAIFVGVDIDADCVDLARKRVRTAPTRIEIHKCDARTMPFADGYFDVVSIAMVLHRLPWHVREQVLGEARRVLRPGGRLLAADFSSRGCLLARVIRDASTIIPGGAYWVADKSVEITRDIANGGFEAPQPVRGFCTLAGAIDLVAAHKPLVA